MDYFGFQTGEAGEPVAKFLVSYLSYHRWMWEEASLAIEGKTSNFLMHLRRHYLKWYAEQMEAQEEG